MMDIEKMIKRIQLLSLSCELKTEEGIRHFHNGHEYVEIGGIKWATMNVGAESETDAGLYFQWGDTQGYTTEQVGYSGEGKKSFMWEDYKYGNGTSFPSASDMTKYNESDDKKALDLEDDAVRANWGGSWGIPTSAEIDTLRNAVNVVFTSDYQGSGVNGLVCTDKTDSSKILFFPAAGFAISGCVSSVGSSGYYWSSSLYTFVDCYSRSLFFDNRHCVIFGKSRCFGFLVRGVVKK